MGKCEECCRALIKENSVGYGATVKVTYCLLIKMKIEQPVKCSKFLKSDSTK